MMDADMCGYLRDESENILGISEIRHRLVSGETLVVNEDIGGPPKIIGKWSYPWYLSKNIFCTLCQVRSEFGQETKGPGRQYVELLPDGYRHELLARPETTKGGNTIFYINNEALFWQIPDQE
ncbi:MAG: hypothetical protein IH591_09275 [Bacteroidales bacterium]|nr:hypothetical protein [Bacteroidales bacterium]